MLWRVVAVNLGRHTEEGIPFSMRGTLKPLFFMPICYGVSTLTYYARPDFALKIVDDC